MRDFYVLSFLGSSRQLTGLAALGWGKEKKKIVFEEEVKSLDELKVMKGCQEKKLGEASWLPDTVEVPPQVDTTAEKCYLRIPLS